MAGVTRSDIGSSAVVNNVAVVKTSSGTSRGTGNYYYFVASRFKIMFRTSKAVTSAAKTSKVHIYYYTNGNFTLLKTLQTSYSSAASWGDKDVYMYFNTGDSDASTTTNSTGRLFRIDTEWPSQYDKYVYLTIWEDGINGGGRDLKIRSTGNLTKWHSATRTDFQLSNLNTTKISSSNFSHAMPVADSDVF